MRDRVPMYPGRVRLTPVPGQDGLYDMVRADRPTQEGTPLNKATLLSDETAAMLGLSKTATPNDAFSLMSERAPVGTILWYAAQMAPAGYLICDGAAVSRTDYAALFTIIGTAFGAGDGSTTFALPDLRAAFIRGAGSQNGYSATFGQKQDASYLSTASAKPQSTTYNSSITTIQNGDSKRITVAMLSPQAHSGNFSYAQPFIRPYNIALTPIIKY